MPISSLIVRNKYQAGFSLIEIAVIMLILSVLLTSAVMSFSALHETGNITQAKKKLSEIEEALYGFAAAQGKLPCPTFPGAGGVENAMPPSMNCNDNLNLNSYIGFVPAKTLGIKGAVNCDGLLIDPWGRAYRYSVSNSNSNVSGANTFADFVVAGDIKNEGMGNVAINGDGYRVCNNTLVNCTTAPATSISSDNAVAIVLSMGKPRANSAIENENAGEITIASSCGLTAYDLGNDRRYISSTRIEQAGSQFDDIIIWISPNILFKKMLDARQLP